MTQGEYSALQQQVALGNQALSTLQTAISTAQASYALLQQQISAGSGSGTAVPTFAPELASSQIVTPEFQAMATSLQQTLKEATDSSNEWLKIVKGMIGIVKSGLAGILGIWGAISYLGKGRPTQAIRPSQPGTMLPRPGERVYYAGFPPIPGAPAWVNTAGYGLAFVALILMGAKLAKDESEKRVAKK
jgi:hypothetical protein